jgi:hypothetical protein
VIQQLCPPQTDLIQYLVSLTFGPRVNTRDTIRGNVRAALTTLNPDCNWKSGVWKNSDPNIPRAKLSLFRGRAASSAAMQNIGQEFDSNILQRVIHEPHGAAGYAFADTVRSRRFPCIRNHGGAEAARDLGNVENGPA